jgi:hypothetical protein
MDSFDMRNQSGASRIRVVLLGSTGSIGRSTIEVARRLPEQIELVGLAAGRNAEALAAQVRETGVREVAIFDSSREAGLRRLGFSLGEPIEIDGQTLHASLLDEHEFFPAAGQGAIGFEIRRGDETTAEILRAVNHHPTWVRVRAEREFLRLLDAGCHTPVGVRSEWSPGGLVLAGRVFPEQGGAPKLGEVRGDPEDPESVARALFDMLEKRRES